jgi:hypothetical protein
MASFLPAKDSALLAWSLNFSTRITATPTAYGLTAALATAYSTVHTNFATALAACDPEERNQIATAVKDAARAALEAQARLLANLVQGTAAVTDAQKLELGLNVRAMPQPVPAPGMAPGLLLQAVEGNTAYLRLLDVDNPTRRGKPADVDGATVFSFVGAAAPTDANDWQFEFNTARASAEVTFPGTLTLGTKVWITAFWFNARKERGPLATPLGVTLLGGAPGVAQAA